MNSNFFGPTEDWEGSVPRPARVGDITLDDMPAIRRRRAHGEVSEKILRFGVGLLAVASIYGGLEAGAKARFGRHAHEVLGDVWTIVSAPNNPDQFTEF